MGRWRGGLIKGLGGPVRFRRTAIALNYNN
jgi:hypothetical protein